MPSPRALASLMFLLLVLGGPSRAQTSVPVAMLSDVHFDPFQDPAKVAELRAKPVEQWSAILNGKPSATQAADLQALQAACHTRALDTGWPLLGTTLAATHQAEPHPLFVTLSGDLLTHAFPCRLQHIVPEASAQDVSFFAAKTVAFVLLQVRQAFPRTRVFATLGNNDSGCADYRETPHDAFLQDAAGALATAAGLSADAVTPEGDYAVLLPAPLEKARLIVLNDIFEAHQFNTCAAAADRGPERAQIDWLRSQLAQARAGGEHVWVMAHIPPGIDVYSSFRHYLLQPAQMCAAEPRPFLADTTLSDALLDYADVVTLALFGHTHMDEIRLLHRVQNTSGQADRGSQDRPAPAVQGLAGDAAVPAKLVPSVSPYVGNHPAFLVASVDPHRAVLKDWRTFVSPGPQGSAPPWTEAYRFTTAFHLPDLSAASAVKLADGFTADRNGQTAASAAFREHFYPGDIGLYALGLAQIWPAYACAVREDRPTAVHDCICTALPQPKANPDQP